MAKSRSNRWVRLTLRMSKPEYDLICWAAHRTGVRVEKFCIDAALSVAIPLRRSLGVRKNLG